MIKLSLIERLEQAYDGCERCALGQQRNKIVHWRGNPDAPMFLIGEAPGADEDEEGRPFVGKAGHMLDVALRAAGIDSNEGVFISNMVACHPPNNRKPAREEMKACQSRLQMLLRIVRPKVLVLLGGTAARLAGATSVLSQRGEFIDVDMLCSDHEIRTWRAIITVHPSYVLRTGGQRGDGYVMLRRDLAQAAVGIYTQSRKRA